MDDRLAGVPTARPATRDDDAALLHVDATAWGAGTAFPSVTTRPRQTVLAPDADPSRTLVAVLDGTVVGYLGRGVGVRAPTRSGA